MSIYYKLWEIYLITTAGNAGYILCHKNIKKISYTNFVHNNLFINILFIILKY